MCLCAWGTAGLEVGGLWALPRNAGKLTQLEVSQVRGKDKAGYGPALFALGGKKVCSLQRWEQGHCSQTCVHVLEHVISSHLQDEDSHRLAVRVQCRRPVTER